METHLQVVKETAEVQPLLGGVPVVVRADVLEAGVGKHGVVVLWEQRERERETDGEMTVTLTSTVEGNGYFNPLDH